MVSQIEKRQRCLSQRLSYRTNKFNMQQNRLMFRKLLFFCSFIRHFSIVIQSTVAKQTLTFMRKQENRLSLAEQLFLDHSSPLVRTTVLMPYVSKADLKTLGISIFHNSVQV